MSYDPWNVNPGQRRFSKFLPEFLQEKLVQWAFWLLVAACIDWQLSLRMSEQQYYFVLLFLRAHIAMFIGFDPIGNISVSFPEGGVDITRLGITEHHYFTGAWSRFCDAIARGFGIAFFFTALSVTLSIANKFIEKSARKQRRALDEIDRQAALLKEQERYVWERPKPKPPAPTRPVETGSQNLFETPEVELLTELNDEPEDSVLDSDPEREEQSREPPVTKPLRQPGRIYRDDN